MSQIQQLTEKHQLNHDEVLRLEWVLSEYEPQEHLEQLAREIKNIMAVRKLADMPKRRFSRETLNRVRQHVNTTGLTNYNPDDANEITK